MALPAACIGLAYQPRGALTPRGDSSPHYTTTCTTPAEYLVPRKVVDCVHEYWGDGQSNPIADPNPRLQLLIEAARRGAKVRLLLDSLFDEPEANRSNQATVEYLNLLAQSEGLDLEARTGNPTGGGIHAKWLLAQIDGVTWSAVGSLNGGEISHKINREVVLLVDHPAVYDRLLAVFLHDWALAVHP